MQEVIKGIVLTALFFLNSGVKENCLAQDTSVTFSFVHPGASTSNPRNYDKYFLSLPGYYINGANYSNNGSSGCGFCYVTKKILSYGKAIELNVKCDGLPCNFKFDVIMSPFHIDPAILTIKKDNEVDLASSIYIKNGGNRRVDVVYKLETYNSAGHYDESWLTVSVEAYSTVRMVPRYVKNGPNLFEQFLTLLYYL